MFLLRKYPLSTSVSMVSVGSWVKFLCRTSLSLREPKFQQGQKLASTHCGGEGFTRHLRGPRTADILTPDKVQPQISAFTSPLFFGKDLLANTVPITKSPPKGNLHKGNMFPDGPSPDSVVFGDPQPARIVWTVTEMPQSNDFAKQL